MFQYRLHKVFLNKLSKINRIIVIGDLHGDYESFRNVCGLFDFKRDHLIFLGDYADRGRKGIEILDGLKDLIKNFPNRVTALKGNHEDYTPDGKPKFMPCNLIFEAKEKKGDWATYFKNELSPLLNSLFLAILIPNEVLFVHGGISSKVRDCNDLKYPSIQVEEDILWSDPFDGVGQYLNRRGLGVEFGEDISRNVCNRLSVKRIVRSHQPRKSIEGPYMEHDGRIITISSTNAYGGKPFALVLPTKNLGQAFNKLEKYVVNLK